jgi:hypothetical protein
MLVRRTRFFIHRSTVVKAGFCGVDFRDAFQPGGKKTATGASGGGRGWLRSRLIAKATVGHGLAMAL